ncbi:uncharacterized protein TNCT_208801 [Trichonephila clavata]|uniref:Uncharacterized protein n=1 Tax=Trichonephila clavata TaxID=2740835 RepID=A0A8X6GZY9_TRICU|nr:uncharacterized protein TNCT_208801 [Trichonephila clavata]
MALNISKLYASVIDEEIKRSNIKREKLKIAARAVARSYSKKSLKKGTTYINYDIPDVRCAYMYKYSALHTGMVTKYFRKLIKKKELKNTFTGSISICSLGGGPGSDIVGIFKALGVIPYYSNRIKKVSILDICDGWHTSFEDIISRLKQGTVKDIPETFINSKKFKHELIEVDLLSPLQENAMEVIVNADIICMVKFVSAVLAQKKSLDALQMLGNLFKPGAVILFIDNFNGNVFESIENAFKQIGLHAVLGPQHETYVKYSESCEEIFGCRPQMAAKVSIVGCIKILTNNYTDEYFINNSSVTWKDESEDLINSSISTNMNNTNSDKYTQTELSDYYNTKNELTKGSNPKEIEELIDAVYDLLQVAEKLKECNKRHIHLCCQCH